FLKQAKDIDEAFKELFKIGDQMKAVAQVDTLTDNQPQEMLEEFENQSSNESSE
ncbi:MAG: hypothetical protein HOH79_01880, partial [Euryarchaeota archaeon]|nr:hypothetical protein [Euryarchaeota archaeon]